MRPNRLPIVATGYPLGAQDLNRWTEAQEFIHGFNMKPNWPFYQMFVDSNLGNPAQKRWGPYTNPAQLYTYWVVHWHRYLFYEISSCVAATMKLNDDTITVFSGANGNQVGFVDLSGYTRMDVYNVKFSGEFAYIKMLYECPSNTGIGFPLSLPNAHQSFATPPTAASFNLEIANTQYILDEYTLQPNCGFLGEHRYHDDHENSEYEDEEHIDWYDQSTQVLQYGFIHLHRWLYMRLKVSPPNTPGNYQIDIYHGEVVDSDYKVFHGDFPADHGGREVRIAIDLSGAADHHNFSGQAENIFDVPTVPLTPAVGARYDMLVRLSSPDNGDSRLLMFHEEPTLRDYTSERT